MVCDYENVDFSATFAIGSNILLNPLNFDNNVNNEQVI